MTIETPVSGAPQTAAEAALAQALEGKHVAYSERNQLVAAISRLWPSHLARHPEDDETWDDEWRTIVCIHSPAGQLTWHIKDGEQYLFSHLAEGEGHWDGHSTPEKYARLQRALSGSTDETCPKCQRRITPENGMINLHRCQGCDEGEQAQTDETAG
ncbi:hypothetical protein LCGC14_0712930 [marine sediment metagenome]|uniref:WDGH domain-containing protein n=1 Tax=marine sediment metagenome TaxID=412755 RepID=A0A0F9TM44_9ZZZZ